MKVNKAEKHLKEINAKLDPHEQLDCLVAVTTAWTVENGFVTPTMKVKRAVVLDRYASLVAEMYGDASTRGHESARGDVVL